jgi:hypothetical protein
MVFYNKFDIETLESVATGNSKSDLSNIKNKLNRARDRYFNGRDAKFKIPNLKNILRIKITDINSIYLMTKSYTDNSIKLKIMNDLLVGKFITCDLDIFNYNCDFDDFVNRYMTLYKIIFKMYHMMYTSYYDTPIDIDNPVYMSWCGIRYDDLVKTMNRYVRELTGDDTINYVQYDDDIGMVFTAEKRQYLYDLLMARYGDLFTQVMKTKDSEDDNIYLLKILSDIIIREYNINPDNTLDIITDSNIADHEIEVVNRWIRGNEELLVKSASKK